ncbi:MAG: hypothetical protein ACE5JX_01810 [Acidobacteriota bacterium]
MSEEWQSVPGRDREPEADDPLELAMTRVSGGDPELMATCLIEEYARMGMEAEEILGLFSQPIYQTHALYQERGETWVRDLVRKVLARCGRMRVSVKVFHDIGGCDA